MAKSGIGKMNMSEFYRDILGVKNERTIRLLAENSRFVHHAKGDNIVEPDQPMTQVYFHLNGVTRGFVIDENGAEHTFGFSRGLVGEPCIGSAAVDDSVRNYVQCMTDVDSVALSVPAMQSAIRTDRSVAELYEKLLMEDANKHFATQLALGKMSGKEKYLWFLKEYSTIVDVVPQVYIASFLGLKPQSLSRIKVAMEQETTT